MEYLWHHLSLTLTVCLSVPPICTFATRCLLACFSAATEGQVYCGVWYKDDTDSTYRQRGSHSFYLDSSLLDQTQEHAADANSWIVAYPGDFIGKPFGEHRGGGRFPTPDRFCYFTHIVSRGVHAQPWYLCLL